jgi:membrane protease YdiL (CAAX protease family)
VLGYLCVRTGSILAPILFHVVFNGLIATGDVVPGLVMGMATANPVETLLAAAGLIVCLALLRRWPPPGIDKA